MMCCWFEPSFMLPLGPPAENWLYAWLAMACCDEGWLMEKDCWEEGCDCWEAECMAAE